MGLKRVVVRHHMVNALLMGPGGSQYVTLEAAIAFAERGVETYIDAPFIEGRHDLAKLAEVFGLPEKEIYNVGIGDPGRVDAVINTSGDVLLGAGDVVYVHYPFVLDYSTYYSALQGIYDMLGKVYTFVNTIAFPLFSRKIKLYIANSSFTASFLRKYLGIDPAVIHPPVNIDDIVREQPLPLEERENYVISVSRLSPEKQPHRGVELAKHIKRLGLRLVIAGSLSPYNKPYYELLLDYARREGVDDVVEFELNTSRHRLVELYRRAYAYIHLTPKEHFGISVVEAMAAGTPVIIPCDSGTWIDVALRDESIALPYSTISEACCRLKHLQRAPTLWRTLSFNAYKRALKFDRREFRRRIYIAVTTTMKWR